MTLLFAAMLGINRLFVADADQGGFDGFLLAPVDRTALLIAKAIALLAYLLVLELIAVPAFGLLLLGPPLGQALPGLLAPLALGDIGVAAIGTLVAALGGAHTCARPARTATRAAAARADRDRLRTRHGPATGDRASGRSATALAWHARAL